MTKKSIKPPTVRLWSGIVILVIGFLSPLLIPVVLATGLSAGAKSVISGLLAFGIPELFMIIAVGIMGKDGFDYLKRYTSLLLRKYGPPDTVSPIRYNIGLVMFITPILLSFIAPYFGHKLSVFENCEITIMIVLHVMLILSLFVLGGDFWEKLRGLFIRRAKIDMDSLKK